MRLTLSLTLRYNSHQEMQRERLHLVPACEACQETHFPESGWTVRKSKESCAICGFLTHFRVYSLRG